MQNTPIEEIKKYQTLLQKLQNNNISIQDIEIEQQGDGISFVQIDYEQQNVEQNTKNTYESLFQLKFNVFYDPEDDSSNYTYNVQKIFNQKPKNLVKQLKSETHQISKNFIAINSDQKTDEMYLELRNQDILLQNVKISDFHGKILENSTIGKQLVWNRNGTSLLYVAQKKNKPTKHGFQVSESEQQEQNSQIKKDFFENNKYEQDCGEKLSGVKEVGIFEYNIQMNKISEILIEENIFPCQVGYLNDANQIFFAGFVIQKEFKYGLHLCNNRESNIYITKNIIRQQQKDKISNKNDLEQQQQQKISELQIISNHHFSFFPSLNQDRTKMVYYGSNSKIAHSNYMSLNVIKLNSTIEEIIQPPIEILPINRENLYSAGKFMGIVGYPSDLTYFHLDDGVHYIFSTVYGGSLALFLVNLETKQIVRVSHLNSEQISQCQSSMSYLKKLQGNMLYITYTNFSQPWQVICIDLNEFITNNYNQRNLFSALIDIVSQQNPIQKIIKNTKFQEKQIYEGQAQGFLYSAELSQHEQCTQELQLMLDEYKMNLTESLGKKERKLLVLIHGGPHGFTKMGCNGLYLILMLMGYRILTISFTGSAGYGQDFLEKLMGQIGEIDAQEITEMVQQITHSKLCNPQEVAVMGGSYGGYMSGIMASRYSELFQCAILSNPVLSMPFNVFITDIPEWNIAECFGKEINWNFQEGELKTMFQKSPFSAPMKIPLLLQLGQVDKRVPYQAALALRAQILQNNGEVDTYLYPKSDHNLSDCPQTEFDVQLKSILFLEHNLNQKKKN